MEEVPRLTTHKTSLLFTMIKRSKDYAEKVEFVPENEKESALQKYNYTLPSNARCVVCNKSVTLENLGAITRRKNEIIVVCDKDECIAKSKLFVSGD
jgi:hypothetical protein